MKNLNLIVAFIAIAIAFQACEKDNIDPSSDNQFVNTSSIEKNNLKKSSLIEKSAYPITITDDMSDPQTFLDVVTNLESDEYILGSMVDGSLTYSIELNPYLSGLPSNEDPDVQISGRCKSSLACAQLIVAADAWNQENCEGSGIFYDGATDEMVVVGFGCPG